MCDHIYNAAQVGSVVTDISKQRARVAKRSLKRPRLGMPLLLSPRSRLTAIRGIGALQLYY